jgi:hypothetical protein
LGVPLCSLSGLIGQIQEEVCDVRSVVSLLHAIFEVPFSRLLIPVTSFVVSFGIARALRLRKRCHGRFG